VLDYLKRNDLTSPELRLRAEEYVAVGYQRLLTFQSRAGGFALWAESPPDQMLTAYSLQHLRDMSRVYPVDPAVIDRAAEWLMQQQRDDGSWDNENNPAYTMNWGRLANPRLPVTAYVVWSLAEAGYAEDEQVQRGLDYVRQHWTEAQDGYSLALVTNALVAADPGGMTTQPALDRLDGLKQTDEGLVFWSTSSGSFMGGTGDSASIETTALAAYALMRAGRHLESAQGAMGFLVSTKDSYGTWGTTQATILALKALVLSSEVAGTASSEATVHVAFNGQTVQTLEINQASADMVHQVTIDGGVRPGENQVTLEIEGESNLALQVTTAYFLPWSQIPPQLQRDQPLTVDVSYDRISLAANDQVTATVSVVWQGAGGARMLLVDLGLPPGFNVLNQDLNSLVASGQIQRYDLTARQLLIYLENFSSEQPLTFQYRLQARFPMRAKTPSYSAYDYYNPDQRAEQAPVEITVSE